MPLPPDPAAAAFHKFSIEAWTLFGISFLVTILRTYARARAVGLKKLQADDYLVWVATIFHAIETALAYSVGNVANGLANNGLTDELREALSPHDTEYRLRAIGSKVQLVGWATYSTLLWALKASLLVFYIRLTAGLSRSYRIRIYVGFGFLVVSWIIIMATLFLGCRPFHKYWQIYPNPGNDCQPAIANQIVWVYLAFNVSTDFYIMSIPIPMLWKTALKPMKKVGLILLFSGGLFVIVCAILRSIMIVIDPINGAQLAAAWAVRETFVAVVATNMPMVFPLMKVWLTCAFGSLVTSIGTAPKPDGESPKALRTFGGGSSAESWRGHRPPNSHPIVRATYSECEERMMDEYGVRGLNTYDTDPHRIPQGNNIRKHIDVTVVHEDRDSQSADDYITPRDDWSSCRKTNQFTFPR